jgi:hypothetical protein
METAHDTIITEAKESQRTDIAESFSVLASRPVQLREGPFYLCLGMDQRRIVSALLGSTLMPTRHRAQRSTDKPTRTTVNVVDKTVFAIDSRNQQINGFFWLLRLCARVQ